MGDRSVEKLIGVAACVVAAGCASFGDPASPRSDSQHSAAAKVAAADPGTAGQGKAKRKRTPAEKKARFEAIAERYRLTHASDDGKIRPDGLLVAASQREKVVELTKRLGLAKAAGIGRTSWTDLGPDKIGGRGRSLVIDPTNADRMWFAAATGGIWTTTDGGANWSPVNDYLPNLATSHMVMDRTNPDVMYAASGEPFASGVSGNGAFRGVGIFKSTDRGATWNLLEPTRVTSDASPWISVFRLAVNPGNGSQVWAGTRGGLWQSIDGGATWQRKMLPDEETQAGCGGTCSVTELAFHPANGNQFIVAAGARIFASSDGGQTFTATKLTDANAARNPADGVRISIAPAPGTAGRFVASVNHAEPDTGNPDNTGLGQVWATNDGGATWNWLATPRHLGSQGDYDNTIWVAPNDANVIVAAGIDVWRTTDGGATPFAKISDWGGPREFQAHADHHDIVHHPGYNGTSNRTVFVTNDGGIQKAADIFAANTAHDASSGWTRVNTKLRVTQFYTIASTLVSGKLQIIGGTQDNGNPLLRPTGTTDWQDITGGDGAGVGIDSRDPRRLYTAYIYSTPQSGVDGVSNQSSICTGAQIPGGCADNNGEVAGGAASNFIAPMILDPNNSDRLLTGTNDLLVSPNPTADPASVTWTIIKNGYPKEDQNYVASIAVAPGNSDVIMVGHNQGQVWRTSKGAQADVLTSWTEVGAGTLPSRYNTAISIDPRDANKAWASYGGFDTGNVWYTADGGQTWTNIHNNLPAQPVYRVLPHPSRDGWLYAATETGIYTSENSGATWTAQDDGPAYVVVHDMTFVGDTLVAGTHGRGAWRADTVASTFDAKVRQVVASYYQTILGRAADQGGLDFWAGEAARVVGLGADVKEVFYSMAIQFFGSAEYVNRGTSDTQYITDMYNTFFSRTPDSAGLGYWQGELTAVGSRSALLNSFLFSAEFKNTMTALFGAASVRPEVDMTMDLFRGTLGRLPDSGGFNFWLGQIRTAQCGGANAGNLVNAKLTELTNLFFGETEYVNRGRNDRDFLGDVYNTYLRRGPGGDADGFNFWVGQIATQGRDAVRAAFAPSAEFQNRVAAIVAAGCAN